LNNILKTIWNGLVSLYSIPIGVWIALFLLFVWIEFQVHEKTRYAKWIHPRLKTITIIGMSMSIVLLLAHVFGFGWGILELLLEST